MSARANARVCVVVWIAPVVVWLSVPLLGSWSVLAHGSFGCVIAVVRSVLGGAPVSAGLRSHRGLAPSTGTRRRSWKRICARPRGRASALGARPWRANAVGAARRSGSRAAGEARAATGEAAAVQVDGDGG